MALGRFAIAIIAVVALVYGCKQALAHHNVYLPLVPNTALMQNLIADGEQTWCVDSRAANYPNFVSQLRDVNDAYAERVGIEHRQVAFGAGCEVRHTMPDSFPCGSGAAACIYYANWPVTIAYKWTLGYTDWRTAHGHELGHGLLGLHEMYADSGSNIGCLRDRTWTVMSCGTGVRYPQEIDVERGCAILDPDAQYFGGTLGCGFQQEPPPPDDCLGDPNQHGHRYNQCHDFWRAPDGNKFYFNEAAGEWMWDWGPCAEWGGRLNSYKDIWMPAGQGFYAHERGYWSTAPPC